jgi:two-component system, LytTR family, sensor kinase
MLQEKDKLFWKLHLIWWAIAMTYATLPTYKIPEGTPITIFFFYVIHYTAMVSLTYLYRVVYNKINPEEKVQYYFFIAPVVGVIIVGGVFFLLNSHGFIYHYKAWEGVNPPISRRWIYLVDCIWQSSPWFMGYHLSRYARISVERELHLQKSLQDSELERLRKQLNPHFLFNALNGIKALVIAEPEKSRDAIAQLSDLLRLSLKTKLKETVTLSEELKILDSYLAIEKIRFHERLNVEIDISKDCEKCRVLPFCLQILAENAIKHGIGKQKKGGFIKISGNREENTLILKVINSGTLSEIPETSEENNGIGLENLRKRLKINFGENAIFTIQQIDNEVVSIISFPLES